MELSISDPEIVKQSGCLVMADKGFLIQDELASVGAKLTLRHFMNGKKQFTKEESDHKKKDCKFENTRGKIYAEIENLAMIDQSQQVCLILLQMPGL